MPLEMHQKDNSSLVIKLLSLCCSDCSCSGRVDPSVLPTPHLFPTVHMLHLLSLCCSRNCKQNASFGSRYLCANLTSPRLMLRWTLSFVRPFPFALGGFCLGWLLACAPAPLGLRMEDVQNNLWGPGGSKQPQLAAGGSQQASSRRVENRGRLDLPYFCGV